MINCSYVESIRGAVMGTVSTGAGAPAAAWKNDILQKPLLEPFLSKSVLEISELYDRWFHVSLVDSTACCLYAA